MMVADLRWLEVSVVFEGQYQDTEIVSLLPVEIASKAADIGLLSFTAPNHPI